MRKIPVSRTVKCPSLLKRLGIFASPLDRYFSQITLTNRIYLYKISSFKWRLKMKIPSFKLMLKMKIPSFKRTFKMKIPSLKWTLKMKIPSFKRTFKMKNPSFEWLVKMKMPSFKRFTWTCHHLSERLKWKSCFWDKK